MENLNTNVTENATVLDAEARKALEQKYNANKKAIEELKKEQDEILQKLVDSGVGAVGDTQYDGFVLKVVAKTKNEKAIDAKLLTEQCIGDLSLLKDLKEYVNFKSPATVIKLLETDYQDILVENPGISTVKTSVKVEVVDKKPKEIEVERENLSDLF